MFGNNDLKVLSTVTLFFFLWFLVMANFVYAKEQKNESFFQKVEELINKKNYDAAIELLKNFIDKKRSSLNAQKDDIVKACYKLALLYLDLPDTDEIIDKYLRLLFQTDPEYRLDTTRKVDEKFREKFQRIKCDELNKQMRETEKTISKECNKRKRKRFTFWKISTGVLLAGFGITLYLLIKCKKRQDAPAIKITIPKDGETVCYEGFNPDGESIITVRGTKSGRDLKSSEQIAVLVKESGGGIWWVSGEIISTAEANTGTWQMQNVSIGKPDDPITQYKIVAMVTTEPLTIAQHLTELPNSIAYSETIIITRGGPCQ